MKWYAIGAIAMVGILLALVAFVALFPVREADVSGLCTIPAAQPHVELRNVSAGGSRVAAELFVVNPTSDTIRVDGAQFGLATYSIARNGKLSQGLSEMKNGLLAENSTGTLVAPHDAARFDVNELNGTFAPGRYVLVGNVDVLCGVARVDIA